MPTQRNLAGTAANFDAVEDLLQGIAPRDKLFLMDTCESGEMDEAAERTMVVSAKSRGISSRGLKTAAQPATQVEVQAQPAGGRSYLLNRDRYIYNSLVSRSGAIVFSSSKGGELSYESDAIKGGFFTNGL